MVKAIVDVSDRANRVLNVVKAKYGLRNKSMAIEMVVRTYEQELMEPELRPEYIKKIDGVEKDVPVKIGNMKDFDRMFGSDVV